MRRRWFPRLPRKVESSIFVKLLLIFATVSVLTVVLIYIVLEYLVPSPDRELGFRLRNRVHYAELLVREMGDPPDLAVVRRIVNDEQIAISIEEVGKPAPLYQSDPSSPTSESVRQHALKTFQIGTVTTGLAWAKIYLILDRGPYRYLFLFSYDPLLRIRPGVTATIITLVLLLLLATFLFTRKLLRPLRKLHEGVLEISRGNWDHRVPASAADEFGDLARSFNRMSERIHGMIESKEQLLLDVSHELRSPMARIAVALELPGSEELIRRNLRELDSMIAELLESARLPSANGALRLERTELGGLIAEVAAKFEGDLPGVRIISSAEGSGPGFGREVYLDIDARRIRGVFKNVIENAIKYSPRDRRPVEISLGSVPAKGSVGHGVEVVVRDFGVGISEKELTHVFEPFYRVDKSRCKDIVGYGLGLSLSKRIMLAHGGDVRLESVPNEGTRVSVIFRTPGESP